MPMHLYTSNDANELVERLGELVGGGSHDLFATDTIVVQSRGMEVWLQQELAHRLGIAAGLEFRLPEDFVDEELRRPRDSGETRLEPWRPARLRWQIFSLLLQNREHEELRKVRNYLAARAGDSESLLDMRKTFQLSSQISGLFSKYFYRRPELLEKWSSPGAWRSLQRDERWQAWIWEQLLQGAASGADAEPAQAREFTPLLEELRAVIDRRNPARGIVTERVQKRRVFLFGVASLSPSLISFFDMLSGDGGVPVHLFALSPSQAYFADLHVNRAERARWTDEELAEKTGNPLLASMGRLSRDFQFLISDTITYEVGSYLGRDALVEAGESATALDVIQSDIFNLRFRRQGVDGLKRDFAAPVVELAGDDHSIAFHACYSPMRQVEALRDQLLELFEQDKSLQPSDVIVMTPDVETYAPLVDAVFGQPAGENSKGIPFSVADRSVSVVSEAVSALLALLDALDSRFEVSTILGLVGRPAILRKLGLDEAQLPELRELIREANIRWSYDADHRKQVNQPELEYTSWRYGLDRLLLSAMTGGETGGTEYDLKLPLIDGIEGNERLLLIARIGEFVDGLHERMKDLKAPRTLGDWIGTVLNTGGLLDTFVQAGQAPDMAQVRMALGKLRAETEKMGEGALLEFDFDTFRYIVNDTLGGTPAKSGFLTGQVTVCGMMPMRAIPFKVVVLLGMDEGAFPRNTPMPVFDQTRNQWERGDRSPREDDRTLFLEAILSARKHLIIIYTAYDRKTNTAMPPSVLVSELLDVCCESFVLNGEKESSRKAMEARFVVKHPLQPFSRRYFEQPVSHPLLFSYSGEDAAGAAALQAVSRGQEDSRRLASRLFPPGFEGLPLEEPDGPDGHIISTDDFVRFFRDPVKWFFTQRLKLRLPDSEDSLPDREGIEIDSLEGWKIGDRLFQDPSGLDGEDPELFDAVLVDLEEKGELPPGALGRFAFGRLEEKTRQIVAEIADVFQGWEPRSEAVRVEIGFEGATLLGSVGGLYQPRASSAAGADLLQLGLSHSKAHGKMLLPLWLRHLLLRAAGHDVETRFAGWDSGSTPPAFSNGIPTSELSVGEARGLLGELVRLYLEGQRQPLLFFPKTSWNLAGLITQARLEQEKAKAEAEPGEEVEEIVVDPLGAKSEWDTSRIHGGAEIPGEAAEAYTALLFGEEIEIDTLYEQFPVVEGAPSLGLGQQGIDEALTLHSIAETVFVPLNLIMRKNS